jgi:quinolinate synthase
MVNYCREVESDAIIIATEVGMLHRLQKECPEKKFIPAPTDKCACNECHFMKMNTLEKLYNCMINRSPELILPPELTKS